MAKYGQILSLSNFIHLPTLVKSLESMINEIRYNGFDKIKDEQDEKARHIKELESNNNILQNSLKIIRHHHKSHNDTNIRLIKETDRLALSEIVII